MGAEGFIDYCLELLAPAGEARAKRMFGGHGLYLDDLFIAIVADERLYLKVDADTQPLFADAGGEPFTYAAKERPISMRYWSVPPEAMESPGLMQPWARRALEAALRARAAERPSTGLSPRKAPRPPRAAAQSARAAASAPPAAKRRSRAPG